MAYDPKLSWAGVGAALSGPGIGPSLNGGYLRIYDGTAPATADDSNGTNTMLAELTLGSTAFGTASSGVMTANTMTAESSAPASGTAVYGRYYTEGGTCMFQGLCGLADSDFILDNINIDAADVVGCASATLRMVRE